MNFYNSSYVYFIKYELNVFYKIRIFQRIVLYNQFSFRSYFICLIFPFFPDKSLNNSVAPDFNLCDVYSFVWFMEVFISKG